MKCILLLAMLLGLATSDVSAVPYSYKLTIQNPNAPHSYFQVENKSCSQSWGWKEVQSDKPVVIKFDKVTTECKLTDWYLNVSQHSNGSDAVPYQLTLTNNCSLPWTVIYTPGSVQVDCNY